MPQTEPSAPTIPVLIAGGGPVGLTLSALLARQGIANLVVEADEGYCTGSRAICIARSASSAVAYCPTVPSSGMPCVSSRTNRASIEE